MTEKIIIIKKGAESLRKQTNEEQEAHQCVSNAANARIKDINIVMGCICIATVWLKERTPELGTNASCIPNGVYIKIVIFFV